MLINSRRQILKLLGILPLCSLGSSVFTNIKNHPHIDNEFIFIQGWLLKKADLLEAN